MICKLDSSNYLGSKNLSLSHNKDTRSKVDLNESHQETDQFEIQPQDAIGTPCLVTIGLEDDSMEKVPSMDEARMRWIRLYDKIQSHMKE